MPAGHLTQDGKGGATHTVWHRPARGAVIVDSPANLIPFAELVQRLKPVLVAVSAVALGRERWDRRPAVALTVAAAGIVLAVAGSGAISPLGVALALISAAIYAAYVLASASLLERLDPLVLAAAISTGASMVLAADAGLRDQLAPRGGATGVGLIVAAALFSSVLATSAFMAGARRLVASRASIVSGAEPALTTVFAFAALGQRFDFVQLLGATLMLTSIPILELRRAATDQHHVNQPANRETSMHTQLAYAAQTAAIKERASDATRAQQAQLNRRHRQPQLATATHVPKRRLRAVAQRVSACCPRPDRAASSSEDRR